MLCWIQSARRVMSQGQATGFLIPVVHDNLLVNNAFGQKNVAFGHKNSQLILLSESAGENRLEGRVERPVLLIGPRIDALKLGGRPSMFHTMHNCFPTLLHRSID